MTESAVTLYISLKREFYKMPKLKTPKPGEKQYEELMQVCEIIRNMGGDPEEYIMQQIRVFRAKHFFPKPTHLLGNRCLDRYRQWLRLKSLREGHLFVTDKESVFIRKNYMVYPLDTFAKPFEDDPQYVFVLTAINSNRLPQNEEELDRMKNRLEYLFAKYEYLHATIPQKLLEYAEKVRNLCLST